MLIPKQICIQKNIGSKKMWLEDFLIRSKKCQVQKIVYERNRRPKSLAPNFFENNQESVFNMNADDDDDLFPNQYIKFLHKYTADIEHSRQIVHNYGNLVSCIFNKIFF